MEGVLEKMSSAQILAAIAILVGGLVALTMILSITRYQMRALEDETELRREQQNGELAIRNKMLEHGVANGNTNLDALLTPISPPAAPSDELNSGLAMRFGTLELDADEIESSLQSAMAVEPSRKQAIIDTLDHLIEHGSDHEAILAAIRPLCATHEAHASTEL